MLTAPPNVSNQLEFAWLELTNLCNLQCRHCYAESSPYSGDGDLLDESDYLRLINEIADLGCKQIQFIGGEPTLNRSLCRFLDEATSCHFDFIEVFTNLVQLNEPLLTQFQKHNVAIATSFYSYDASTHDAITTHPGSFNRTVSNIRRVIDSGLRLRVGIIQMDENREHLAQTRAFLQELGVSNIGTDHLRDFGRASSTNKECDMGQLCGSCSGKILAIGPDGIVSPCTMSKAWSVGSVFDQSLAEISSSLKLNEIRQKIGEKTKNAPLMICPPKTCNPACQPNTTQCYPCGPNGCNPCYPKG